MNVRPCVLSLALLAGCNWVYGLDDTQAEGPDGDGIGAGDNCPTIANPNQDDLDGDLVGDACDPCIDGAQAYEDVDRDGIDDGCDPCPRGAGEHDEDGDGFIDACDSCPGVANADQLANVDGDDLGDACDPDPLTLQTRIAFVGFDTLPQDWYADADAWVASNDSAGPTSTSAIGGPATGLWNRSLSADGPSWMLAAAVRLPAAPSINYVVGIGARTRTGFFVLTCQLFFQDPGRWFLSSAGNPGVEALVTSSSIAVLRMTGYTDQRIDCQVDGAGTQTITMNLALPTPVLYVENNTAEFLYVDFLD